MTVDPTRCPDCGARLTGAPACKSCGLLLRGPLALRLWEVSTEIDRLAEQRATLIRALRPGGSATAPAAAPRASAWDASEAGAPLFPPATAAAPATSAPATSAATAAPHPAGPPAPVPGRAPAGPGGAYSRASAAPPAWEPAPRAARPRKEWTPQRVQNLLLMTGTLLLVVAAVAFTAFTWGRLPVPARGAIMLALTGVTAWSARWVHRRGLTASAEAIALLTVLFGAVDAYAARAANVGGLGGTDPATYASVASGVLAALAAAYARVLPVRSVRYAALAGAQLPLAVTAFRVDGLTFAERGAFLAAQAAALGLAAYRLDVTAFVARVCGAVNWAVAVALAGVTAYGTTDLSESRVAALVLAAAGAVALLWPGDKTLPAGIVTLFAVGAVVGPARLTLTFKQLPAVIAAAGLAAVVAAAVVDRAWRRGPAAVGASTVGVALAIESGWVAQALLWPFQWLGQPWGLSGDVPVRTAIDPGGLPWVGTVVSLAVVAIATLVAPLVADVFGRRAAARWPVIVLASLTVVVLPLGFQWSLYAALAWYLAAGVAGLALSYALRRVVVAVPPAVVLALATVWSLANEGATLVVLLAVTLASAAYAALYDVPREAAAGVAAAGCSALALAVPLSRDAPLDRAGFVLAATTFGLMAAGAVLSGRVRSVEGVAALGYAIALCLAVTDAGWLAWTLGGGALTAGATAFRPGRRWLASTAALLTAGCAATTAVAFGRPAEQAGFAVVATACAIVAAGGLLRMRDVEIVGGVAYASGAAFALPDPTWLSYALGLGALTAGASAVRDRVLSPVAAALAIACAGTSATALGAPLDRTGFVVAVAAAVALAVATVLRDEAVEGVAAAGYAVAVSVATSGAGWLAWTLGAGAVAAGVSAARRRWLAPVAALLTALCATATGVAFELPPEQTAFAVVATACAIVATGSLTRYGDVSAVGGLAYAAGTFVTGTDPAWLSYALGLGALTSGAAAVRDRELAPLAAALAIACAGTSAYALGAPLDRTAVAVAFACVAAVAAGALLRGETGDRIEVTAGLGYAVALGLAGSDPGWLSWVLVIGGVTALADAMRPDRRWLNWVATVLLTAWAWDRLWLEDVRMPEAYAAPVAAILLGLGYQQRRRVPDAGSWRAYGPGLGVAFVPTTYLVFTDPGVTRPVVLALAAVAVLLAGVRQRLQAPLTVGAGALAIDALVQLAPVAVALPKWATIGAAGLLVIAVGVTYEDRRRDVERLREEFDSLT